MAFSTQKIAPIQIELRNTFTAEIPVVYAWAQEPSAMAAVVARSPN